MLTRALVAGLCRLLAVFVLSALASACGGGGGGDSGGGGGGGGGSDGAFTISTTSASFSGLQNLAPPPRQNIALTLTGTGIAKVGAAFQQGQVPGWLGVNIVGTAPNYTVTLDIIDTALAPAHYTATLLLGTADASDNVLQSKQVAIAYDLGASITVTPSATAASFVYGSSVSTAPVSLAIGAQGKSWTITTGAPWLHGVPGGTQTGSATLPLTIDAAMLIPGSTSAHITVRDTANAADVRDLDITVTVTLPTPVISVNPVVLGGTDGLGSGKQTMDVSIDTGTNQYPWTLTLSDPMSEGWLTSTLMGGSLGGTQHAGFDLGFDRTKIVPGHRTGLAKFSVTVKGSQFNVDVPVSLNWQSHRLFTPYNGIAFAKFPDAAASLLTRTLAISSSRGIAGVQWTATSDKSWLHVNTPSGTTGVSSPLTLTADPNDASVQLDAVNIAIVTLASTDPTIERNETIRVGFWASNTNPVTTDVPLPTDAVALTTNPVEPYAYGADDNGVLRAYNVYTGAIEKTFTPGGPLAVDAMVTSSDGLLLFISSPANRQTLEFDAGTLAPTTTPAYDDGVGTTTSVGQNSFVYTRPNGHPILWSAFGNPFDLEMKGRLQLLTGGVPLFLSDFESRRAASPDGGTLFSTMIAAVDGLLEHRTQSFTVLGVRGMELNPLNGSSGAGGNANDMCVTASGNRLASLGAVKVWTFTSNPADQMVSIQGALATPTNVGAAPAVACGWDNRIYVGLSTANDPQANLYVFDADGTQIGAPQLNGPNDAGRFVRELRLSGDNRRAISVMLLSGGIARVLSLSTLPQ